MMDNRGLSAPFAFSILAGVGLVVSVGFQPIQGAMQMLKYREWQHFAETHFSLAQMVAAENCMGFGFGKEGRIDVNRDLPDVEFWSAKDDKRTPSRLLIGPQTGEARGVEFTYAYQPPKIIMYMRKRQEKGIVLAKREFSFSQLKDDGRKITECILAGSSSSSSSGSGVLNAKDFCKKNLPMGSKNQYGANCDALGSACDTLKISAANCTVENVQLAILRPFTNDQPSNQCQGEGYGFSNFELQKPFSPVTCKKVAPSTGKIEYIPNKSGYAAPLCRPCMIIDTYNGERCIYNAATRQCQMRVTRAWVTLNTTTGAYTTTNRTIPCPNVIPKYNVLRRAYECNRNTQYATYELFSLGYPACRNMGPAFRTGRGYMRAMCGELAPSLPKCNNYPAKHCAQN